MNAQIMFESISWQKKTKLILNIKYFRFTPGLLHHLDAEEDIGFKALTSAPIACVIAGIVVVLVVLFGCIGAWREGMI